MDNPAAPDTPEIVAARAEMDRLPTLLVDSGGSDLHLRVGQPPILRKDGQMVREDAPSMEGAQLHAMLTSTMAPRDIATFSETHDVDYAYELDGQARFRCNAGVDRGGPIGVFRIIPSRIPTCDELDLSEPIRNLCSLTKGMVLVTGPTGSGKSTTLAALLDQVNRERSQHIVTIEDPIEFVHESKGCLVTHRQVGVHTKSFRSGLRAALREDPDVVLIGEMRDLETVEIAMATAETGHLLNNRPRKRLDFRTPLESYELLCA